MLEIKSVPPTESDNNIKEFIKAIDHWSEGLTQNIHPSNNWNKKLSDTRQICNLLSHSKHQGTQLHVAY